MTANLTSNFFLLSECFVLCDDNVDILEMVKTINSDPGLFSEKNISLAFVLITGWVELMGQLTKNSFGKDKRASRITETQRI